MITRTTSKEAFASIKDVRDTHKRMIMRVMRSNDRPLTYEEIAKLSNGMLTEPQVWRRLSELERAGVIEYNKSLTRLTKNGRRAGTWEVVNNGKNNDLQRPSPKL